MLYSSYEQVSQIAAALNSEPEDDWLYVVEARGCYWALVVYDEDGLLLGDF